MVFYYNLVSTTLWFCCLARLVILLPLVGRRFLPAGIADFFHVVSVFPLLGFILVKVLAQRSRSYDDLWNLLDGIRMVWICYGVIFPHPKVAKHTSYSCLIASWCIAKLVDSCYYAFKVKTKTSPAWLFWLHFHHFYLTLFSSAVTEMILLFLSLAFVSDEWHELALKGCILLYVPVTYFLFQHLQSKKEQKYNQVIEKRNRGRQARQNASSSNDPQ